MKQFQWLIITLIIYVSINLNTLVRNLLWPNFFSPETSISMSKDLEEDSESTQMATPSLNNKPNDEPVPIKTFDFFSLPVHNEYVAISVTPVYHYSFDGNVIDQINGIEGKLTNKHILLANGISGQAYSFSDYGHYIELPTEELYLKQGTVSLWLYLNDYDSESSYIFTHHSDHQTRRFRGDDNRIEMYIKDKRISAGLGSNHHAMTNIQLIELKKWYHFTLTWENNISIFYINGEQKKTESYEHLDVKGDIHIGTVNPLVPYHSIRRTIGIIDELKIWNRPLKPIEVTREYEQLMQ